MPKITKRFAKAADGLDSTKAYPVDVGVKLLKARATA